MATPALVRRVVTASLVAAATAGPAQAMTTAPFSGATVVDPAHLAALRGGLKIAGLEVDITARLNTYIDDRLALSTEAQLTRLGEAQAAAREQTARAQGAAAAATARVDDAVRTRLADLGANDPGTPSDGANVPSPAPSAPAGSAPASVANGASAAATADGSRAAAGTTPAPAGPASAALSSAAVPSAAAGPATGPTSESTPPATPRTAASPTTAPTAASAGDPVRQQVAATVSEPRERSGQRAPADTRVGARIDASPPAAPDPGSGITVPAGATSVRHTINPARIDTTILNTADGRAIRSAVEVEVTVHNFSSFSAAARRALAGQRIGERLGGL